MYLFAMQNSNYCDFVWWLVEFIIPLHLNTYFI